MAVATYTILKGDTVWDIVEKKNLDTALGVSTLSACKMVCLTNKIPYNDNTGKAFIAVGQKIVVEPSVIKKPVPVTKPSTTSLKAATMTVFGVQPDSDRAMLAQWEWDKTDETKQYDMEWSYQFEGNSTWFAGHDEPISTERQYYMFTAPSNASVVRFRVKPITNVKIESGAKKIDKWTSQWTNWEKYSFSSNPPSKPSAPTVTIVSNTLTARLDNVDLNYTHIVFQVVEDDKKVFKSGTASTTVEVVTGTASYSCPVNDGHTYKVRCRAKKGSEVSEWSDYSGNNGTKPKPPSGITTCKAASENSVYLKWSEVSGTEITYEIEYSTKKEYFDISSETTTINNIVPTAWTVTGLESGQEYFFRVRAVQDGKQSEWTSIKSVIIGTKPSAPTTWSSTTTAITGESLVLYWVHNSEDNSSQSSAKLELLFYVEENLIDIIEEVINTANQDDDEKTMSFAVDTTGHSEGSRLIWRVQTAGVTSEYGEWSTPRTVDIYARPTIAISMMDNDGNDIDVVESFPIRVLGLTGPSTQTPMGFHISVEATESYETTDPLGNPVIVRAGSEVFSEYINSSRLNMTLSANNIDLENGINYILKATASMNSGLMAETSSEFRVEWTDERHTPDAEIGIDKETLSAYIRPYCEEGEYVFEELSMSLDDFISYISTYAASPNKTAVIYDVSVYSTSSYTTSEYVNGVLTRVTINPGDVVYAKRFYSPEQLLTEYENGSFGVGTRYAYDVVCGENKLVSSPISGVTLSVYRREFDGTFKEISSGIDNLSNTFVTDPHPSLDYARYRIVATTTSTGAVSFSDVPGVYVGEQAVVIQWDEDWSKFDIGNGDFPSQPPWAGSMLKLPYNIDVSDSYSPDYSLVSYIGRKNPVGYYGTQIGSTSTWNVEIDKNDFETLYALRRLAIWMGNAYVREPSGSGYWAKVDVSFSQNHRDLTIPITLNISRVEGGI